LIELILQIILSLNNMNVSELARQLKVNPQKLLQILPEFGYDVGARAVKIDDRVAEQIRRAWRNIKATLDKREIIEKEKQKELEKKVRGESGATVVIPQTVTVRVLADLMQIPVTKVIMELIKNGVLANQNENIDYDTAALIAQEFGFKTESKKENSIELAAHTEALEKILSEDDEGKSSRPPVVVVMGHVDHGKTKLLDAIRSANVVAQEAGGITQHIGAYQVMWTNPKTKEITPLTFIDTPGHEAFTVMRSRGAKVADIAILVVAADDSVKPQTVEAINIIKAAKLPMVVAINKMDKEGADVKKVKADLSQYNVLSDDWGGDTPMVEISALKKLNIDKLLDTLLLVGDMNAENIKANADRPAAGTIIEAHVDKGEGPVATILVQTGTLNINDPLVINGEIYGKVRAMKNYKGEVLRTASPSCPARILGFKVAPQVGDVLDVGSAENATQVDVRVKKIKQTGAEKQSAIAIEQDKESEKIYLNVVVKADVLGSLEAIVGSLGKIQHGEVGIKVVGKGLGNITADDVSTAVAGKALILGFNVIAPANAREMMEESEINFQEFHIIYDLLDFVKEELEKLLIPELVVTEFGILKIVAIFRAESGSMIVGGRVEDGKLIKDCQARVKRSGEIIGKGQIAKLQIGQQAMSEVPEGSECGANFIGKTKLEIGDVLEAFKEEKKFKKLVLRN